MTAVLALSAILVAIASRAFAEWRASADMKDAINRIGSADAVVRQDARTSGSAMHLIVVPETGAILRSGPADGVDLIAMGQFPGDVRVERVLPDPSALSAERFDVSISPAGRSRSYAVLLAGAGDRRQWVAVAGLTGQVVRLADEQEADELIGAVRPGDDTH